MMAGRTNFGAFGSVVCSTSVTVNPALRMESSVGRLQSHQATTRLSQFIRSQAGRGRIVGSHVLEEEELAAGPQYRRSSRSARG